MRAGTSHSRAKPITMTRQRRSTGRRNRNRSCSPGIATEAPPATRAVLTGSRARPRFVPGSPARDRGSSPTPLAGRSSHHASGPKRRATASALRPSARIEPCDQLLLPLGKRTFRPRRCRRLFRTRPERTSPLRLTPALASRRRHLRMIAACSRARPLRASHGPRRLLTGQSSPRSLLFSPRRLGSRGVKRAALPAIDRPRSG